jgi:hypothetical protein
MDPRLELFDPRIRKTKHLENSNLFNERKRKSEREKGHALTALLKRPKYSVSLAYTLSVASKLVYEDVDVIRYELEKAGFDVEKTFRPIAYKVKPLFFDRCYKVLVKSLLYRMFALLLLKRMILYCLFSEGKPQTTLTCITKQQ